MSEWPDNMTVKPILAWPAALHGERKVSSFSAPWASTLKLLNGELRNLNARDVVLQVAIEPEQFRLDGKPRAGARQLHPGVILTMTTKVGPLSYPCDTFTSWRDNLRAIALALEALRAVDRYGVTARGEQYQGFAAIEAASASEFQSVDAVIAWLETIAKTVPGREDVRTIIRSAFRSSHPDLGGDAETFDRVVRAETYLKEHGAL